MTILGVIGRPAILDQFKVEVFVVQDDIGQEPAVSAPFLAFKFQGHPFAGKSFPGIVRRLFSQKGVPGLVRVNRFGGIHIQEANPFAFSLILNIKGVAVHHPHHLVRVGKTGQYQDKQHQKHSQTFFFHCQQIRGPSQRQFQHGQRRSISFSSSKLNIFSSHGKDAQDLLIRFLWWGNQL